MRNRAVVLKWLTSRLGNAADADDVLQSAYLRVWAYADHTRIENPRALLFKTAAHLATNELIRRARGSARHDDAAAETLDHIAASDPDPEERAELREEVERTLAAIDSLPPRVRDAFRMSRFEGRTYAEIAAALDVSESSVEKYMIEALRRLRAILQPTEGARVLPFRRTGTR